MIWRGLVSRLTTVAGVNGPYVELHDAIVIQEFCDAFNVKVDDVSAKLETFCHPVADRWQ